MVTASQTMWKDPVLAKTRREQSLSFPLNYTVNRKAVRIGSRATASSTPNTSHKADKHPRGLKTAQPVSTWRKKTVREEGRRGEGTNAEGTERWEKRWEEWQGMKEKSKEEEKKGDGIQAKMDKKMEI